MANQYDIRVRQADDFEGWESLDNHPTITSLSASVSGVNTYWTVQSIDSVVGGSTNSLSGNYSSVIGGTGNVISGTNLTGPGEFGVFSSIVGGEQNKIYTPWSFIGGGLFNEIALVGNYGYYSSIVGGIYNAITGSDYSIIGGGESNTILSGGIYNTIPGGILNKIYDDCSYNVIDGGNANEIGSSTASDYNTIVGGDSSAVDGFYSTAIGSYSVIEGNSSYTLGEGNQVVGDYSIAIGDYNNITTNYSWCIGESHTITGDQSVGIGTGNVISSDFSFTMGTNCTAAGLRSIAFGNNGKTKNRGQIAFASVSIAGTGSSQGSKYILVRLSTNNIPVVLTTDALPPLSGNQIILQSNQSASFFGTVVARKEGGSEYAAWKVEGLITTTTAPSATTLSGLTITEMANVPGWTLALTADTTNGGLAVTFTGVAATNIRVVANIDTAEIIY